MKTKNGVRPQDLIIYAVITLAANYAASALGYYILKAATVLEITEFSNVLSVIFSCVIIIPLIFITSITIITFYLKKVIPMQYEPTDTRAKGLKKALIMILPGEILRLIICSRYDSILNSSFFSYITSILYELTYLKWTNRFREVLLSGKLAFQDYLGYFICYIIYFSVYLCIILFICSKIWKSAQVDWQDSIFHDRYISRPKFF
ncbi:MAG: hypothetical protein DBX61_09605 [Clostridiales bacterium]|nr:MAG: hypothetical protein DBX61_09605 [Clostridiales bacterium]